MIIKYSDGKIVDVIKDAEHNLDDEGTRKAMDKVISQSKIEDGKKEDLLTEKN